MLYDIPFQQLSRAAAMVIHLVAAVVEEVLLLHVPYQGAEAEVVEALYISRW
jgi:hypothetical protein